MEKKVLMRIVKLSVFVAIANLPFLTITQLIGIDTFIDSFQHPRSYQYINSDRMDLPGVQGGYIILQRPTNQEYFINQGDTILYYSNNNILQQRVVSQILFQQGATAYYTENLDGPVYDQQIIGKIKGSINNNIWNTLCLQIWDISLDNLNIVALFSND